MHCKVILMMKHCNNNLKEDFKNVGVIGNPSPLHELKQEQMDYTMANNFYSVFFCCKHEIQQFLAQNEGGVIVNNASIAGLIELPGTPAYISSKHAVNGLTKNLALDYARYNIRVSTVNPAGTEQHQWLKNQ